MNIGWNIESVLSVGALVTSTAGSVWIIRKSWKQYGLLFVISGAVGVALCYLFIYLKLYTFPFRLFPSVSAMPITLILTVFPLYVMLGVRYSPKPWLWKLPFYMVMVHIGVTAEAIIEQTTQIIRYESH